MHREHKEMINEKHEDLEDEVKLIRVGDKFFSIRDVLDMIQDKDEKKRRFSEG